MTSKSVSIVPYGAAYNEMQCSYQATTGYYTSGDKPPYILIEKSNSDTVITQRHPPEITLVSQQPVFSNGDVGVAILLGTVVAFLNPPLGAAIVVGILMACNTEESGSASKANPLEQPNHYPSMVGLWEGTSMTTIPIQVRYTSNNRWCNSVGCFGTYSFENGMYKHISLCGYDKNPKYYQYCVKNNSQNPKADFYLHDSKASSDCCNPEPETTCAEKANFSITKIIDDGRLDNCKDAPFSPSTP